MIKPITWQPIMADGAAVRPPGLRPRPIGLLTFFDDDLRPARAINDWLLDLSGDKAKTTTNDYGREVARFANFIEREFSTGLLGPDIVSRGDELLRSYAASVIRPDERDDSVRLVGDSVTTLGKRRAALLAFYWWAVDEGLLRGFPFKLVTVQSRRGPVRTLAHLRGGRRTSTSRVPIPTAQINRFLQVGVRGQLPSGAPDPDFLSYESAQRNAAGFGLSVGLGLRHQEILGTTIFEVPPGHPDGLTPARIADAIAKGGQGRNIVGLSEWLKPVHQYIGGDRSRIARRATWFPHEAWEIALGRTTRSEVAIRLPSGRETVLRWNELNHEQRLRLVIPGHGSPMVLLNHRDRNGSPLTDRDSLNDAFTLAGSRCQHHWPALDWSYSTHSMRHTYATEITEFLSNSSQLVEEFASRHGRRPAWAELLLRQDKSRIVQDSMGHRNVETTNLYRKSAFWALLLSVAADPQHNPAIRSHEV